MSNNDAANQESAVAATAVAVAPAGPASLKAMREARGMSVSDAASRLRLSVKQIDALEAGEWAKLPGDAFARGALRSYGKVLGFDVSGLLSEIGGFGQAAEVRPAASLATKMPRQGAYGFDASGRNSWLAWGLLAAFAVLAIGFFYGGDKLATMVRPPASEAGKEITKPIARPIARPSAPAPSVQPAAPVTLEPAPAAPAAQATAATTPTTADPVAGAVTGTGIELLASSAAWIEVKESGGKVVFSGNLKPAEPKVLSDVKAPLQLVVGSARSVQLKWRGQPVDLTPKTRDDVARLTLE